MASVSAKPAPRCPTTAFFPLATREESTGFIIIKVLCEMLWAQLPVLGLFQLTIRVTFILFSYGPILSCSCAIGGFFMLHLQSLTLPACCLLCIRFPSMRDFSQTLEDEQQKIVDEMIFWNPRTVLCPPEAKYQEQECKRTDSENMRETKPDWWLKESSPSRNTSWNVSGSLTCCRLGTLLDLLTRYLSRNKMYQQT